MNKIPLKRKKEKHGMCGSKEYHAWESMIQRCHNVKNTAFKNYGGRGIIVCSRWRNSFMNFFEDMGRSGPKDQIDRIDNYGNYTAKNCRWVDRKTNNANRRDNRIIEFKGERLIASEWARKLKILKNGQAITNRIARGLPIEEALFKDSGRNKKFCINGHQFIEENRSANGSCKICNRIRESNRRKRLCL